MTRVTSTLIGLLLTLLSFVSQAQPGGDPAVTSTNLLPAPIVGGVGAPFSLTFLIGNNGAGPILGNSTVNKMGFGICLSQAELQTGNLLTDITGDITTYFDLTLNPVTGCIEGKQKQGVALQSGDLGTIIIAAKVTVPSTTTSVNNIGASINISPAPSTNPQPQDNDFASIYTHTVDPMPVSLVSFSASAQADKSVLVNWSTSWEKTNQKYVIERSKDLRSFEPVGEVSEVSGNSSSLSQYRYVDPSPYRGTSYYRLRQVDVDGRSETFRAVSVVVDGRYGVYPNPVSSAGFTLELDEPTASVLHLYNATGVEMGIQKSALSEASAQVKPSGKLSSGVYILTVEERGTVRKHRLVVQ